MGMNFLVYVPKNYNTNREYFYIYFESNNTKIILGNIAY